MSANVSLLPNSRFPLVTSGDASRWEETAGPGPAPRKAVLLCAEHFATLKKVRLHRKAVLWCNR